MPLNTTVNAQLDNHPKKYEWHLVSSVTRVLINSDALDDVLRPDGDDVAAVEVAVQDVRDKDSHSNNHRHTNTDCMMKPLPMLLSTAVLQAVMSFSSSSLYNR